MHENNIPVWTGPNRTKHQQKMWFNRTEEKKTVWRNFSHEIAQIFFLFFRETLACLRQSGITMKTIHTTRIIILLNLLIFESHFALAAHFNSNSTQIRQERLLSPFPLRFTLATVLFCDVEMLTITT